VHALIIEQDAFIVCMIEDALRESGFSTFAIACSVQDAVDEAKRRCPDLITSAISLGSDTGIDAVQTICADQPIPVVYISSSAWQVRDRLADAIVVQKPFLVADLKSAITKATTICAQAD
jgi:chemotaxis response regulator CheB